MVGLWSVAFDAEPLQRASDALEVLLLDAVHRVDDEAVRNWCSRLFGAETYSEIGRVQKTTRRATP